VRAGKLRHRITIQTQTKTQDTTGSVIASWSTFATLWASVDDESGREGYSASQVQSERTTNIRIREYPGITPKMRVVHGADAYDIESVIRDPTHARQLQLICVKRGAQGFRDG
jgi:SPP1 family predicted phage head-tail adaptor